VVVVVVVVSIRSVHEAAGVWTEASARSRWWTVSIEILLHRRYVVVPAMWSVLVVVVVATGQCTKLLEFGLR